MDCNCVYEKLPSFKNKTLVIECKKCKKQSIFRLIIEWSVAWEFCGNNTSAKLKITQQLNKKLKTKN